MFPVAPVCFQPVHAVAETQAAGVPPVNYAVVPIEGFWINWNGYYDGYALQ